MRLRGLLLSSVLAQTIWLSGCASPSLTGLQAWEQASKRGASQRIEAIEATFLAGYGKEALSLAQARADEGALSPEVHFRLARVALLAAELAGQPEQALPLLESALRLALQEEAPQEALLLIPHAAKAWARLDGQSVRSLSLREVLEAIEARGQSRAWAEASAFAARELVIAHRLSGGPVASAAMAKRAGFLQDWKTSAPWGEGTYEAFFAGEPTVIEKGLSPVMPEAVRGVGQLPPMTNTERFSDGEVLFFDLPSHGGQGFATHTFEASGQSLLWVESNRLVRVFVEGLGEVASRTDPQAPWLQVVPLHLEGNTPRRITVSFFSPSGGGLFRLQLRSQLTGPEAPAFKAGPKSAQLIATMVQADRLAARPRWDFKGASQALASLQAQLPEHPWLELLAARLAQGDSQAASSEKRERARAHYQRVLARGPSVAAWRGLARLEQDEERFEAALGWLREALAHEPNDTRTAIELLNLYTERSWEVEALSLVERLRPHALQNVRVGQEIIHTLRTFGRLDEALTLAHAINEAFPGLGEERLNLLLRERGQWRPESWAALAAAEPQRHQLLRQAVEAYRAQGDFEQALALVNTHLSYRPGDGWALGEVARIELERKNPKAAQAAIEKALSLHPDFSPLESLSAMLRQEPERFDTLEPAETILSRFANSAAVKRGDFAPYPLVTVLERTHLEVAADGSVVELRHRVRLVQNKQGIDQVGDLLPPEGARLLRTRTIKRDGRVLEPERTPGKAELSFPELEPGDAVETAWVTRAQVQAREGGYLTGVAFAQLNTPTAHQDIQLRAHPSLALKLTSFGGAPKPQESQSSDGWKEMRWELHDRLPVGRESFTVSSRSFFPFVDIRVELAEPPPRRETPPAMIHGPCADGPLCPKVVQAMDTPWDWIAGEYRSQLHTLMQPGPRTATYGSRFARESDPVLAAYRFVMEEVNPFEELNTFQTSLEVALSAKRGNRALVLAGLLREMAPRTPADEAVDLILCAPERDGPPEDRKAPTPNANRFSYPLVRLSTPQGPRFIDTTRPFAELWSLPRELNGAQCLDIDGRRFIDLPQSPSSPTFKLDLKVNLAANGDAQVELLGTAHGANAAYIRQAYASLDPERRRLFFEQWLQTLVGDVQLDLLEVEGFDQFDRPMRFHVKGLASRYANPEGSELRLNDLLPMAATADLTGTPDPKRLFNLAERKTPLRLMPLHETVRLSITLPEGFKVSRPPESVQHPMFKQSVSHSGQNLTLEREVLIEPGRIAPSDYVRLRAEAAEAMKALEAGVVLTR